MNFRRLLLMWFIENFWINFFDVIVFCVFSTFFGLCQTFSMAKNRTKVTPKKIHFCPFSLSSVVAISSKFSSHTPFTIFFSSIFHFSYSKILWWVGLHENLGHDIFHSDQTRIIIIKSLWEFGCAQFFNATSILCLTYWLENLVCLCNWISFHPNG